MIRHRAPQSSSADFEIGAASVVGDSVWDMLAARRARALGIGVLSGGYGQEELERAGAYRVYEDPADLLRHIDEVGGGAESWAARVRVTICALS
jgi:hypothetical protein